MASRSPVEAYARNLPVATTKSVRSASVSKTSGRVSTLANTVSNLDQARQAAAEIKDYVLDHLVELLEQFEAAAVNRGTKIHWARDAAEANKIILELCQSATSTPGTIAKAKSMATEEIHLNHHLQDAGFRPVETDLGEYVVQIDHDTPSHIVTPIIHKNRFDIAQSFLREGLGDYTEIPEELAMQARAHLRETFRTSEIGISGVNFALADSGRIVLVENEGNNRFSTTVPRVHIALMGIEKVLPSAKELPLFLRLLAGSATAQKLSAYTHLVDGPRQPGDLDGPEEVHIVIFDNNRSKVMDGKYREILRCIRCGACQNACPVYRQASGHAYGHVYSGPIGAVLAPALEGVEHLGFLAKASTLCGECEEVCPVKIPIPRMLLQLREEAVSTGAIKEAVPWSLYSNAATHPFLWRTGLTMLPIAGQVPVPHPMRLGWAEFRDLPERRGNEFRRWWGEQQ